MESDRKLMGASMGAPELYALLMSGYEPIDVVIGAAAISMGSRGFGRSIRAIFQKGEMTAVSQTAAEARKIALQRVHDEARSLNADMVIIDTWDVRDLAEIVEVTCIGTALRKVGDPKPMPMATATN